MNPLRGPAWRTRTFLSEPVHDSEARLRERLDQVETRLEQVAARLEHAEAVASDRFDHLVSLLHGLAKAAEEDRDESRRLHVVLRSQLEDRQAEIASLSSEVEGLRGSVGATPDRP